jgi:plasmid replication initiation protein
MNIDKYKEKRALHDDRDHRIVKANSLIQKSRYDSTMQEQKIILYLTSKIMPEDEDFKLYEFKIKDFCEICGIDYDNGKNYKNLKDTIKNLADKSMWVTLDDGRETLLRWIERPYIEPKSGIIQIKLDNLMKPYLLQLKERFTQYSLYYILAMRSQYSIRLYELLKSYENLRGFEIGIDEFKKKIGAEKYKQHTDFMRRVLDSAVSEINKFSDIDTSYKLKKDGRRFSSIIFAIKPKKEPLVLYETFDRIEKRLDPKRHTEGQLNFFQPKIEGVKTDENN